MTQVLIIDDEVLIRRSLKRALQTQGIEAAEAEDGEQGLRLWQELQPQVVFLDVIMPNKNGPDVLKEISPEIRHKTRVVMMSAFTGQKLIGPEGLGDPDYFFEKPFDDVFKLVELTKGLLYDPKV